MKVYTYDKNTKKRTLIKDYGDLSLKKKGSIPYDYVPVDRFDHLDYHIVSAYPHLPKGLLDFSTRVEKTDEKEYDYIFLSPISQPIIFCMKDREHMNVKENEALITCFKKMITPICKQLEAKYKKLWTNLLTGEMSTRWSTPNIQQFMWRSIYREKACDNYNNSYIVNPRLCFLYIVSKTIFEQKGTGNLYLDYNNILISNILETVQADAKYDLEDLCHFKFEMNYILQKGKIDNWEQTDKNGKPNEIDFAKGEEIISNMLNFLKPIWNYNFFNRKVVDLSQLTNLIREILEEEYLIKQLGEEKPKTTFRLYNFNLAILLNVIGILKDTRNKSGQLSLINKSVKATNIMRSLCIPDKNKNTIRFITAYHKDTYPYSYNVIFKTIGRDTIVEILGKYDLRYYG